MRTAVRKLSSRDGLTRRQPALKTVRPHTPKRVPVFTGSVPIIQRKPLCPCDGGCPVCTNGGVIQPQLTIGQPDDKYEQEADRMADLVMRMPISEPKRPLIQRQADSFKEEEEEEPLQTKTFDNPSSAVTPGFLSNVQSLKNGGHPLLPSIRSFFEPRFGRDFSSVRVHTDAKAADAAKSINAKAFTTGKDVVFGTGQYSPETSEGKRLLAHELVHVLQQSRTNKKNKSTFGIASNVLTKQKITPGMIIQRQCKKYSPAAVAYSIISPGRLSIPKGFRFIARNAVIEFINMHNRSHRIELYPKRYFNPNRFTLTPKKRMNVKVVIPGRIRRRIAANVWLGILPDRIWICP